MRILLVDDDQGTRLTLGFLLSRRGFEVRTASDGPEALRLLRQEPYDWLVTDADMSPMSGFLLASLAKQTLPALRIVMISAVFEEKDASGFPILRFFPKPVDAEAVAAFLQGHPQPPATYSN